MILQFPKQVIHHFRISAFSLSKGEIVVIHIPDDHHSFKMKMALVDMLTGKNTSHQIELTRSLRYVEHIHTHKLKYRLFPLTVKRYLKEHANSMNPVYKKIYKIKWIIPETRIDALSGSLRKFLSLYATLSWTKRIVFDLAGVDPQGGKDVYKIVKNVVKCGGAAILIDHYDDFRNDCSSFTKATRAG